MEASKFHERSHIDYWAELVKRGKVPNTEYEEFPRGRVAYHPGAANSAFSQTSAFSAMRKF